MKKISKLRKGTDMRINAINSFNYVNNYQNKNMKNQSFGHIVLSDEYLTNLRNTGVTNEEMTQINELSKKTINLKDITNYDKASPAKKKILDVLFAQMPESEVNDLTVKLNLETFMTRSTGPIHNSRENYSVSAELNFKLPYLNKDFEPVYEDIITSKNVHSTEWHIKQPYNKTKYTYFNFYDQKSKEEYKRAYEAIKKDAKEEFGCVLKKNEKGFLRAIPTEDTFKFINKEILRHMR